MAEDRIVALAEAWASMDGKLERYQADDGSDPKDGTRDGYNGEAAEMIKRLNARGFDVVPIVIIPVFGPQRKG